MLLLFAILYMLGGFVSLAVTIAATASLITLIVNSSMCLFWMVFIIVLIFIIAILLAVTGITLIQQGLEDLRDIIED